MTLPLLSGCGSLFAGTAEVATVTADPICKAAVKPICVSANDVLTQQTAAGLLKNNEGMLAVCPGLRREFDKKKCPAGQKPAVPDAMPVKPTQEAKQEPKTS